MRTSIRTAASVSIFLVFLTVLFFSGPLFSVGQFFFGDISQNHYPARMLIKDLQQDETFPLWNQYISSGQPLYANPNNLLFHPISLFFLVLPFDMAFKYSIILQYLLCAAGMYLFCREIGSSVLASFLSASLFAFSGFMLSLGHLYNLLCAAAWIPLFMFLLLRVMRGTLLFLPAAALTLAIIVITAEPFFILSVGLLCIGSLFMDAQERSPASSLLMRFGRMSVVVVSAFLLSMFLILPAGQMFMLSERGAGLSQEVVSRWSLTSTEMAGTVIPHIFGDPLSLNLATCWGGFFFKETLPLFLSLYIGLPALLLALITFLFRDRVSLILWALLFCSLFFAFGSNNLFLDMLIDRLPFLSSLRYMSKFFLLFAFAISVLSGKGLDVLVHLSDEKGRVDGKRTILLILPVCIAIFSAVIYYVGKFFPQWCIPCIESMFRIPTDSSAGLLLSIKGKLLESIIYASGVSCAASLVIAAFLFVRIRKGILGFLFIVLIVLDLFLVHGSINPSAPRSFYRTESPFLEALDKEKEYFGVYREKPPKDLMLKTRYGLKEEGFFWNRMVLLQWTGLPYRIHFAFDQNVDRLESARSYRLMTKAQEQGWASVKKVLTMSGVSSVIAFGKIDDTEISEVMEFSSKSNYPVMLYRNPSALPRIYAVGMVRAVRTEEDALREVLSATFDPSKEAIIVFNGNEEAIFKDPLSQLALSSAEDSAALGSWAKTPEGLKFHSLCTINEIQTGSKYLKMRIDAQRSGFLVLCDSYYPGWECRIDGHPSTLFQTNYLFKGVSFEEGEHIVEFMFRPLSFYAGLAVSGITLCGLVIFSLLYGIRNRKVRKTAKRPSR